MSTMNATRYRSLYRYAGAWLGDVAPRSVALDELESISARSGIYVVCEPLERVQYVGSVRRPNSVAGVADRLREHLREGHKRLTWKTVWVLPLKPETPVPVVRSIEACVGADVGPLGGDRLPRL
ncbi:MAG: hypothetical protein JWM93_1296 [Frankiales bacterium]|nr:hypothetical protein [Frankiales bacterium]